MQVPKDNPPTPLTGGVGRRFSPLGHKLPSLPKVDLSPEDPAYATLMSWGWDTIQQSYDLKIPDTHRPGLERAKEQAQANRESGDGYASIIIGGEDFRVRDKGAKGGVQFIIENEWFLVMIKGAGCSWGVSVRYTSVGLWLRGYDALREWVLDWLSRVCSIASERIETRISRADWCFDFHSPSFTGEFDAALLRDHIVAHSSSKVRLTATMVGTSARDETLTIGSIKNLQLTVYDKGKEITDISGKDYFIDIWVNGLEGEWPWDGARPDDVWRLEVRMGKEFLKTRECRSPADLIEYRAELIAGALARIRLVTLEGEEQKRNRPMHPLWSMAMRHCDVDEQMPAGDFVSGRREVLMDQMAAQIAGTIRSHEVLAAGDVTEDGVEVLISKATALMQADPDHEKKAKAAQERYRYVERGK